LGVEEGFDDRFVSRHVASHVGFPLFPTIFPWFLVSFGFLFFHPHVCDISELATRF